MREGGFPFAAQAGLQALNTLAIDLVKDRTRGESFPQIEGNFFYVESVDLPCRASFTVSDESQSVGLSSGFQMNMPFKGLTIFHENYTVAPLGLLLRALTSKDPRAFNQFVLPATQLPLPRLPTTPAGGVYRNRWPIPPRMRFANLNGSFYAASVHGNCLLTVRFLDSTLGVISGPSSTNPPFLPLFTSTTEHLTQISTPVNWFGTNTVWRVNIPNIPLPSPAKFLELLVQWDPASFPIAVTDNVDCYIF